MSKISKRAFEVLYYISIGRNTPERLNKLFGMEMSNVLIRLEKKELIKISYRDNKIYAFMETEKGNKLIYSEKYSEWFKELEG